MKNRNNFMKKLSVAFATLATLLTNAMCVVVTCVCINGYHAEKHHFTSAPWEVGFLFIIPFAVAIAACAVLSYIAKKKSFNNPVGGKKNG